MLGSGDSSHIVKLRGLPFSTTVDDVLEFLQAVDVVNGKDGVHLTEVRPGRPSGECFVEVSSQADVDAALKKDKENMGKRYIEVFSTDRKDMEWALNAMRQSENGCGSLPFLNDNVGVVKLRGLPFGCSKEEIVQFFNGMPVSEDGVHLLLDNSGRASGEAFVQFPDKGAAEQALSRDREKIGHRYIEVFLSSADEVRSYGQRGGDGFRSSRVYRPTPYDRNDRFQGRFGRGGGRGGYVTGHQTAPEELTVQDENEYCQDDLEFAKALNERILLELQKKNVELDRLRIDHTSLNANFSQLKSAYDEARVEIDRLQQKVDSFSRMFSEHETALDRIRFLEEELKEAQDKMYRLPDSSFNDDNREYFSPAALPPEMMLDDGMFPPPANDMNGGGFGGGLGSGGLGSGGGLGRGGFRGGRGGGFCVHMRGLPYRATPQDIAYFFKPIRPLDINILYDNSGRPSGEADVEFECHEDAMRAMRRDKNNMDSRYIELFLNSTPGGAGGGNFRPNRNFRNY